VQDSLNDDTADSPELMQAVHHLERVQNSIWRMHSRFAELDEEEPLTWSEVDRVLEDGTAILYVYIGTSEQFAVLLEAGRRLRYDLVAERSFDELTKAVLEEFRTPNSRFGVRAASARALSSALLAPIADRLETIDRLVVVPDAGMHSLPIAALPHPDSSQPLLRTHEITIVPSLRAALRYSTGEPPSRPGIHVAAVGDPVTSRHDPRLVAVPGAAGTDLDRLWGAKDELRRLQQIFGPGEVSVYAGFDARKALFLGLELAGASILHISAHGVSNESLSARSGVFLSTLDREGHEIDGHLGVQDLFGVELRIPLVVLSGCETSLGERTWSEGPIGIARAFQYSGVSSVVSTLWRIDDKSAAILIEAFYESLVSGTTVPAALRSAQLALMQNADYRHPYYWAAFQPLGDWSLRWESPGDGDTSIVQAE
jgi:CHAT domain-containing protein